MSGVVVAGGVSKRFGEMKGLAKLNGKPLILHVLDRLNPIIDDVVVVVSSERQRKEFGKIVTEKARIVIDKRQIQSPTVGALTGFENVQSAYALLLGCDTPFLSTEILSFLLEICEDRSATIPRWPNGNIEPLHAVYKTEAGAKAAREALKQRKFDMRSMIANLPNVRYVSTLVLRQLDPKLETFFNINTLNDLKAAETFGRKNKYA